jgi:hypothetical protein
VVLEHESLLTLVVCTPAIHLTHEPGASAADMAQHLAQHTNLSHNSHIPVYIDFLGRVEQDNAVPVMKGDECDTS